MSPGCQKVAKKTRIANKSIGVNDRKEEYVLIVLKTTGEDGMGLQIGEKGFDLFMLPLERIATLLSHLRARVYAGGSYPIL